VRVRYSDALARRQTLQQCQEYLVL
jgi:hypothetical protein